MHPQLSIWLEVVLNAFNEGTLVKIVLSKPGTSADDLKSIDIKPVLIKSGAKLSFTYHHKTRDIVKNYSLVEAQVLLQQHLSETFFAARLHGTPADVMVSRQGDAFVIATAKPTMQQTNLAHNRAKNHLISSNNKPYLHALGLTDANGEVLKTAKDKFRQINKYIEIVDGLIRQLPERKLRIVDMGAGKGYLTFALYDHVAGTLKRDCEITGVEYREDLVAFCNEIARASHFTGLKFIQGTIAQHDCTGADIVIALHACDTATDDAIAKAIKADAQIIVVAPCCHKQIRREMKSAGQHHDLAFLLRFGTYEERLAEMVTDGLRAQFMELSNYACNLFEFISPDHTPKNIMIVGQKLSTPRPAKLTQKIAESIAEAKQTFGISAHRLEQLLDL